MSFDQLMDHAYEIQDKAARKLARNYLRSYESLPPEWRQQVEMQFADIPDQFAWFADMPNPSAFEEMLDHTKRTLESLCFVADVNENAETRNPIDSDVYTANPNLRGMTKLGDHIGDWTGRAAEDFKSTFVDPFPAIISNQYLVASILRSALKAEQAIWAAARHDIDELAHRTLQALDDTESSGGDGWAMTCTVVGAVAAVAAVPLTGGTSLALEVVSAASSVAAGASASTAQISLGGKEVLAVINSMREAILLLINYINDEETKIKGSLERVFSWVSTNRRAIVSPRPALTDATAANIRSLDYMGPSL